MDWETLLKQARLAEWRSKLLLEELTELNAELAGAAEVWRVS